MPFRTFTLLCLCKSLNPLNQAMDVVADSFRLLFMTYNGWVMVAMSAGWFLGYLFFGGNTPATKEAACH